MNEIKIFPRLNHKEAHILVFGAGGQLGKEFQYLYEEEKWPARFTFLIKEEVSILDEERVTDSIQSMKPDWVINCAAYTAVDSAETNQELARQINVEGPANIAKAAAKAQIPFVHFSTDYVYHNDLNRPLLETDVKEPKGVYACTKWEGEQMVIKLHPQSFIFRTSWVYSTFGHNFMRSMLRLSTERDQLSIVSDQIGSPTWARDLARSVLAMIAQEPDLAGVSGIYNYSNHGVTSWYDFAMAIFDIASIEMKILPIPSSQYPTPAQRPFYSVMDKSKFEQTFEIAIPYWRDSLQSCLSEML